MVIHPKLRLAEQISNMDFNIMKLWRWDWLEAWRTDHWKGRKILSKSPNTVTQLNDFLSAASYLTSLIFVHTCLGWFRIRGSLRFFLKTRPKPFQTATIHNNGVKFQWGLVLLVNLGWFLLDAFVQGVWRIWRSRGKLNTNYCTWKISRFVYLQR